MNINVKKILFAILVSTIIVVKLSAQSADNEKSIANLRNFIPPSPNSSAIAKYGEWPVSLYTGVPSIAVPVYTIKAGDLSVPIDLSYHAAGIKVGEVASWVGLGWSLNSGGLISRSIVGLPDESPNGYFFTRNTYNNPQDLSSGLIQTDPLVLSTHLVALANGEADTEPDQYNLNILGQSYKLFFKADNTIETIPYSNLKITSNITSLGTITTGQQFNVLLENGTQIIFGGGTNFIETTENNRKPDFSFTNSWVIQKIISPTGRVFFYNYTPLTIKQDSYFSESDYIEYTTKTTLNPKDYRIKESSGSKQIIEKQTVYTLMLSSIESDLEKVFFNLSSDFRQDLDGAKKLESITVQRKTDNAVIAQFNLTYEYSTATPSNEISAGSTYQEMSFFSKRLKLLKFSSVAPNDPTNTQNWTFEYNPNLLPSRRSFAQDYWGFYNGMNNNNSLLPDVYFVLPNNPVLMDLKTRVGFFYQPNSTTIGHPVGNNKDAVEQFAKAESLQKITYPTGGYSKFNFESNRVQETKEQFTKDNIALNLNLSAVSSPFIGQASQQITITKPQYVYCSLQGFLPQDVLNDFPGAKYTLSLINNQNQAVLSLSINSANNAVSSWFNVLAAGTYTVQLTTNLQQDNFYASGSSSVCSANFRYDKSLGTVVADKLVGGLRIKDITNNDGVTSIETIKKYFYDQPLEIDPINVYDKFITTQDKSIDYPPASSGTQIIYFDPGYYTVVTRSSSSKFSLGNVKGGTVGYGKVQVSDLNDNSNGIIVSYFVNQIDDDNISPTNVFPYPPTISNDHKRGLLIKEEVFNNTNQLLKQSTNDYDYVQRTAYISRKTGYGTLYDTKLCSGTPNQICNVKSVFYKTNVFQVRKLNSVIKAFDNAGNILTTTTNYYYDNPLNTKPTRVRTINSKGEEIIITSRTPLEKDAINTATPLSTEASTAIDTMLARNIIDPVLQTEQTNNGNLISRSTTLYKIWPNTNYVLPASVLLKKGANTDEIRLLFNNYDAAGNLIGQQKINDLPLSYIWDYRGAYPIAQATNAAYGSISYTSFEADGKGNWDYAGTVVADGITGSSSYDLGSGNNISRTGLNAGTTYTISYWIKNGATNIGGTALMSKNGWTLYEATVSGITSITISGYGLIDELRMYPKGAQMITYTYIPLAGMSSQCDMNNRISYYEYDAMNRLKLIRDMDKNIIKTFDYTYQQIQY